MTTKPFLKTIYILMIVLLLATSLTACRKPASTPIPEATVAPTEGMGLFENVATQTAVPTAQPVQPTAEPVVVPVGEAVTQPTAQPAAQPETKPSTATQPQADTGAKEYPEPTAGIPQTYTLQKGEYAYCIARRFNINPAELLALNGLGPSTIVSPGTVLKIPQTGNPFITDRALQDHPTTYTVQAGDTIYTIACGFGDVSPDMIALVNGLKEPYDLNAGDKLDIP